MKTVLINAISVKEGGSVVVLDRLVEGLTAVGPLVDWHVVVDGSLRERFVGRSSVICHGVDNIGRSPLHLMNWYQHMLPRLIGELRADVVYSQTNYLPLRRIRCPSLLLVQHAGHFSADFERLVLAQSTKIGQLAWHTKRRWVAASLKRATTITVQTQAMADAIAETTRISPDRVKVVPHGPGVVLQPLPAKQFPIRHNWRIGYVTRDGVQKNFATLFRALRRARSNGRPITLVLTLGPQSYAALRPLIDGLGIEEAIDNVGDVPAAEVPSIYADLDAFVFPSTCESFGFPMIEAMASGLPVVVSDTPTNREITGGAALLFGTFDDGSLAEQFDVLMSNRAGYEALAVASVARARQFSWDRSARLTYDLLQQTADRRDHHG